MTTWDLIRKLHMYGIEEATQNVQGTQKIMQPIGNEPKSERF